MLKATAMASYLESHAKRAYASGPEAETTAAKAILLHIKSGDLKDGLQLGTFNVPGGHG